MRGSDFVSFITGACRVAAGFDSIPKNLSLLRDQGLEIIEICIDLAEVKDVGEAKQLIDSFADWPIIARVRPKWEGGKWKGKEAERLHLLRGIAPVVSAVDVELAVENRRSIAEEIKADGAAVIMSQHNFDSVPDLEKLIADANTAFSDGADIYKIACTVANDDDVTVLEQFTKRQSNPNRPCIVIGMGKNPYARRARLTLPTQGSVVAFAFCTRITADGQLSLEETVHAVHKANSNSTYQGTASFAGCSSISAFS